MITALIRKRSGAAKPPNLSALRQIITQYGLTRASILSGPGVSPSGHLSRRCHPAPDPKGFALWTPNRRCHPVPGPKVSPLDTDQGYCVPWTPAQRACRPLHSRRSARCRSCPCTLSCVLFSLVRSMRHSTGEHIPIGRSFFFQAAMSFDRNIIAKKGHSPVYPRGRKSGLKTGYFHVLGNAVEW